MSCQQVPRITEDPYTFTDTAPTTATLFNPQIHKLTPIIQNTNVKPFLSKKSQISLNQPARIFNSTSGSNLSTAKAQKTVSVVGRLNGVPVSITSNSNIVNGLHKIPSTSSTNFSSIGMIKTQSAQQPSQITSNNSIIKTSIAPSPLKSLGQNQAQKQSLQQIHTLPQIVSLHQSHPLYSVAKQTQILTTSVTQGNTSQTLHSIQQQNQQKIQLKQSSNPPQNIKQKQVFTLNSNAQVLDTVNEITQKTVIEDNHSIGNASNSNANQISIPKTFTSTKQDNIITFKQQPTQHQFQISSQRLPASNFSQPQQIKHLAFSSGNYSGNSFTVSNNKNTSTDTKKNIQTTKSSTQTAPPVKKQKTLEEVKIPIALPMIPTSIIEKPAEKPVFVTPPAKRDFRIPSTGSNSKTKTLSSNILSDNGSNESRNILSSNNCPKNKTQNFPRMKRAYSQSSHHETLQRIPRASTSTKSLSSEWHAPDTYIFDSLGPFSTLSLRDNSYLENLVKCDNFQMCGENDFLSLTDFTDTCNLKVQKHWLTVEDIKKSVTSWTNSRERQIELKKCQLRRQALQHYYARKFLSATRAKKRFSFVSKTLKKLDNMRKESSPQKRCLTPSCNNASLVLASYCNLHITQNSDQHLFLPCTAKFSDNTQCRIPVFDISHNLPLCKEHAWKRDNYQRIVQEHKPKKITGATNKRNKSGSFTKNYVSTSTSSKRSKKKRKPLLASDSGLGGMEISSNSADGIISSSSDIGSASLDEHLGGQATHQEKPLINSTDSITSFADYQINSTEKAVSPFLTSKNDSLKMHDAVLEHVMKAQEFNKLSTQKMEWPHTVKKTEKNMEGNTDTTQDSFNVCENSSAYASSEDTGFGALSDAELIAGAHDVIEEIPLGDTRLLEEHDLTNVLNQLPVDAINEFFTTVQQNGPLEPTQEEQEFLERALEMANKQVQEQMNQIVERQIEQMNVEEDQIDPNFLESFLVDNLDADICTEIVYSPNANDLDTNNFLIEAESNGTNISNGSCNDINMHSTVVSQQKTSADIRNLVQT